MRLTKNPTIFSRGSMSALSITEAEAKTMVENEGFMFQYLPKQLQTKELEEIAEQWWVDNFTHFLNHYKSNPQEVATIMAQARVAGSQISVSSDMRFEVELDEID